MLKRCIALLLIAATLNLALSCSHTVRTTPEKMKPTGERIMKLAKLNGDVVIFDEDGGAWFQASKTIEGFGTVGDSTLLTKKPKNVSQKSGAKPVPTLVRVPTDSVLQVWVKRSDGVGTFFTVLGIAALAVGITVAIIAATKDCCPFVYSWTGERYEFDAEPLGGAICQALQRSDCSRLDYLVADEGQYRLMFRNEVPEIQYIDRVQLLVVDHAPNSAIVPDSAGILHEITAAVTPTRAVDENGNDIASFVSASDGVAWQTQLLPSALATSDEARHHWTFTFPKPQNAKTARVIYNAGTAIWGSNMIRDMLQLRGSQVDAWYAAVNQHGPKLWELFYFNLREEMYFMKLYADKAGAATEKGFILGSGPFLAEDRVTTIDVSDIPGDSLVLSCNPAKTFWTMDYLAVEYDAELATIPLVIEPSSAKDQTGKDLLPELSRVDSTYYVMPEIGDWSEMIFAAPADPADGRQRSIFLKTAGWYEVKIDKTREPQIAEIDRILQTPDAIVHRSIEQFNRWHAARVER